MSAAISGGGPPEGFVLLANGDLGMRELVALRLRDAGYEVATAANGEEALELYAQRRPDLLLLDVSMPVLDGLEVCRRVQHDGPTAPPVIFLTARSDAAGCVEGLEAGAVDYVTTPFRPAELVARIQGAIRAKVVREALAREATTDGLTGLLNRRGLERRAHEAVELARRYRRPLACLMVDIDLLKTVNDERGHRAGDAVLRHVAERLRASTRLSDVVGRYGGDEFVLLLPEADLHDGRAAGEKIRREVAATAVAVGAEGGASAAVDLRVSVGVACFDEEMTTASELLDLADQALYEAKRLGRDRVVVAKDVAAA
jgi:two-component system, cell cycle response regulator